MPGSDNTEDRSTNPLYEDLKFGDQPVFHNTAGKERKSRLKFIVASSVICLAAVVLITLVGSYIGFSNEGLGSELDYGESARVFYSTRVTREEARRVGDHLRDAGAFGHKVDVHLEKSSDVLIVSFFVSAEATEDPNFIRFCEGLRRELATSVFRGHVEIHLCHQKIGTFGGPAQFKVRKTIKE